MLKACLIVAGGAVGVEEGRHIATSRHGLKDETRVCRRSGSGEARRAIGGREGGDGGPRAESNVVWHRKTRREGNCLVVEGDGGTVWQRRRPLRLEEALLVLFEPAAAGIEGPG